MLFNNLASPDIFPLLHLEGFMTEHHLARPHGKQLMGVDMLQEPSWINYYSITSLNCYPSHYLSQMETTYVCYASQ
jgi:hypothetical protein